MHVSQRIMSRSLCTWSTLTVDWVIASQGLLMVYFLWFQFWGTERCKVHMWQPQWQMPALTCQTMIQAIVGSGCNILSLVYYVCSYYVAPGENFKVKESCCDLCEATTLRQTFNLNPSFVCLHSMNCTNGKTDDPLFNHNYILLVCKWEKTRCCG